MSQISAAALPAGTKQLALITALFQLPHDSGASRLRMPPVLFEHDGKVLTDEFRSEMPRSRAARESRRSSSGPMRSWSPSSWKVP